MCMITTIMLDDAPHPYPAFNPCSTCGRAPEFSTGPLSGGCGPFLARCLHGRTREEIRAAEDAAPPPLVANVIPGLVRVVSRCDVSIRAYRSWDWQRCLDGWNYLNPLPEGATHEAV